MWQSICWNHFPIISFDLFTMCNIHYDKHMYLISCTLLVADGLSALVHPVVMHLIETTFAVPNVKPTCDRWCTNCHMYVRMHVCDNKHITFTGWLVQRIEVHSIETFLTVPTVTVQLWLIITVTYLLVIDYCQAHVTCDCCFVSYDTATNVYSTIFTVPNVTTHQNDEIIVSHKIVRFNYF